MVSLTNPYKQTPISSGGGSGALVAFDFIAGTYQIGGSSVSLASIIDKPGNVDSTGLAMTVGAGNEVNLIGDALTAFLLNEFTILVEWHENSAENDVIVWDRADAGTGSFECYSGTGQFAIYDSGLGTLFHSMSTTEPVTHRCAITRNLQRFAVSVDGNAATHSDFSVPGYLVGADAGIHAVDRVVLGGFTGNSYMDGSIRKLSLYAPVDDAGLMALSA